MYYVVLLVVVETFCGLQFMFPSAINILWVATIPGGRREPWPSNEEILQNPLPPPRIFSVFGGGVGVRLAGSREQPRSSCQMDRAYLDEGCTSQLFVSCSGMAPPPSSCCWRRQPRNRPHGTHKITSASLSYGSPATSRARLPFIPAFCMRFRFLGNHFPCSPSREPGGEGRGKIQDLVPSIVHLGRNVAVGS